ncbi:MAG: potassium-transporting ATPase subunit KdpC [Betaproteobacteria bacterium]|nr:potassium-transporting ATPase subunit KdpC [Betaproteobacteria bacterium]
MKKQLKPAILMLLVMTVLTGLVYPLLTTGVAQLVFPYQANGSLIEKDGKLVGSALIGQQFTDSKYFWGRLSGTGTYPYNASASGGTNLGPLNPALADNVKARIEALGKADQEAGVKQTKAVPIDLVTASGSGLDPHVSVAAAEYQLARVAKMRGIPEASVRELVAANTQAKWLGLFGDAHVNVLKLNLAVDTVK